MSPTTSKIQHDYGFHSTQHLKAIVEGYGKWVRKYLDMGWDGYLVQVMFHDLAGSKESKIIQMKQEVERLYNRLSTRLVRKPNSPSWAGYLANWTLYCRFTGAEEAQGQKEHDCGCLDQ